MPAIVEGSVIVDGGCLPYLLVGADTRRCRGQVVGWCWRADRRLWVEGEP